MLKCMNAWAAPNEDSYEKMFSEFAQAGFEGVELNFELPQSAGPHSITMETTNDELRQVHALADQYGLKITSVCAALLCDKIGTLDRKENELGMREIRRQMEIAKMLGSRSILVYAGGFTKTQPLSKAYARALDIMREMRPEFEAQDVLISIENANQFFLSPFDYARFIDDIGSDKVGAYLDFANVQLFQYPFSDHWLEALGERVFNVHIKDYKPYSLGIGAFVPLLAGEVPYKRIMPMLKNLNYQGPLVAEVPGMMPSAPRHLYRTTRMALDVLEAFTEE